MWVMGRLLQFVPLTFKGSLACDASRTSVLEAVLVLLKAVN